MNFTPNGVEREKQLNLLVHLHDATLFEMSHFFFQNSIKKYYWLMVAKKVLTAHNWQKWKSTPPGNEIYRGGAANLETSNYTLKKYIYEFWVCVKFRAISWKICILLITA